MPLTAQDAVKQLVADELRPTFKARGFRTKGLTFYRQVADNFGLVQLQKSQASTAATVQFTINLGVFSGRIQRVLSEITWMPDVTGVPTEPDCHLRQRIGHLLPEARDTWWSVRPDTNLAEFGTKLRLVLEEHAFPFLDARVTDEGLRDHWLQHMPHLRDGLALAVLVRDLGPRAMLAPLLERLRAEASPSATFLVAAIERFAATLQ
ncbi:DUF4304 domain-containing protein [Pendulispora brunnea]|uniref:DUF4304 domain-containing protein n=1 Tax=Pendulispora brunnea TaxID=2905690 RepID=A0ABZ2JYU6_9BACT